MSKQDRDVIAAILLMALSAFISYVSFTMPSRGDFTESPGIFPGLMGALLFLFAMILLVRAIHRGGRLKPGGPFRGLVPLFTSPENRPLLLGILFPGIFVLVAAPLIGFYYASALFLAAMFFLFERRWPRWVVPIVAAGVPAVLYLLFNQLFMLQIK
ncbi:MAG TPA: tripartite tricarboxylate transporter TctB family protein [Candidatus Sulfotelmatobacter sp.]|nr:tripartite tricarboxylate transporter TctB family protein [Candidatus Sulfotelmatobacter sp.]